MNHLTNHLVAVYTAQETERLLDLFFKHLTNILLLSLNGWQVFKLNAMDRKRATARGELAYLIDQNRQAIERTCSPPNLNPDDLPPSMRIDP